VEAEVEVEVDEDAGTAVASVLNACLNTCS
jgi:hypothetical protein